MKYNIKLGKDKIFRVKISGDSIKSETKKIIKEAEDIIDSFQGKKASAIVYIEGLSLVDYSSVLEYRKFLNHKKLHKMAFLIKNKFIVDLVKMIVKEKVDRIKFFNNEEEAIIWIKQK